MDTLRRIYLLNIPFKMQLSHAMAKRNHSDSLIFKLTDTEGNNGYGEAVVRDYVSGSLGVGKDLLAKAKNEIKEILEPLDGKNSDINFFKNFFTSISVNISSLPLLCAVETAVLDLICSVSGNDIYDVVKEIGIDIKREKVRYGGTLPILPDGAAEKLLHGYRSYGISNIRIKINKNPDYTKKVLLLGRRILGDSYDLRVDANASWDLKSALENLKILKDFDIKLVEQPFERDSKEFESLLDMEIAGEFDFVADESAITLEDIERIAETHDFSMVNIRLSKNGGIFKALEIAEKCAENGIKYQIGCHVGETGILSAVGRVAASLVDDPVYTDGSYDAYILEDNVTTENMEFGFGGYAEIIRGKGIGFKLNEKKLEDLSVADTGYF